MFNKHEERPMFYGTCRGRHMGPYPWEKQEHRSHHHHQPQMWCYMMPMHRERWHHKEHKPHVGCHGRNPWEHGMNHHEMNPHKFKEMFHKMDKMKEEHSKKNFAGATSDHHGHGFCRRKFTAEGTN